MGIECEYNHLFESATGQEIFDLIDSRSEAREHSKEGELKC